MATGTTTFSHDERRNSSDSDDQTLSTNNHRTSNGHTNGGLPRPGQHLDDADLLAWKRQYMNIALREQNVMSNSADDLTQLIEHIPLANLNQGYDDGEDEELHLENGNFDYESSIRERLIKANEDLNKDDTPVELLHKQRVSFDAIVKAVDIEQDPQELNSINSTPGPSIAPIVEETSTNATSPQNENNTHEYTVPLNDTQPREGPTLTETLRAMQFHGIMPTGPRWASSTPYSMNGSSAQKESLPSNQSHSNSNSDVHQPSDMTNKSSSVSPGSMVVSINGGFELQDVDDYTAKGKTRFADDQEENSVGSAKVAFVPRPPTQEKQRIDSSKPPRPLPSSSRPKSSDVIKRTNYSTNNTGKSWSGNTNGPGNNAQRPRSAISQSVRQYLIDNSCGIDFVALNQKAIEEKRAKEQAERRKKEEAKAEQAKRLEKAKESFEKWIRDKDAERKRFSEEKRLEKEDHDTRETECEKELAELREKKYQDWLARKNREVMLANEFKKLQKIDAELASGSGSTASLQKLHRKENERAFQRWLRRKYEQSREEQRQIRIEARRLRRRQRRSIKRFQLQQDLQLARAFGYS